MYSITTFNDLFDDVFNEPISEEVGNPTQTHMVILM